MCLHGVLKRQETLIVSQTMTFLILLVMPIILRWQAYHDRQKALSIREGHVGNGHVPSNTTQPSMSTHVCCNPTQYIPFIGLSFVICPVDSAHLRGFTTELPKGPRPPVSVIRYLRPPFIVYFAVKRAPLIFHNPGFGQSTKENICYLCFATNGQI